MQSQCEPTAFEFIQQGHFRPTTEPKAVRELFKRSVTLVELEIFSYCNRRCWFCPNAHLDRRSENLYMAPELYQSILRELAEIDYAQTLSFGGYNEPLADQIVVERLRQARVALPLASLEVSTNGDYLTTDYLAQLYTSGLRSLNIQVYLGNKDRYDHSRIRARMEKMIKKLALPATLVRDEENVWLEATLEFRNMSIRLYGQNFEVTGCNRGLEVPIPFHEPRTSPCLSPFHQFHVNHDGSVMPCQNLRSDAGQHRKHVITNLSTHPGIFRAFASETAAQWRRNLISFGEKQHPCKGCRFAEVAPTPAHLETTNYLAKLARHSAI